jgi:hypothetical protein
VVNHWRSPNGNHESIAALPADKKLIAKKNIRIVPLRHLLLADAGLRSGIGYFQLSPFGDNW